MPLNQNSPTRADNVTAFFSAHARRQRTAFVPHSPAHARLRPLPASEQRRADARCRDRHKLHAAYAGDHVTSIFSAHLRLLNTAFAPHSSAHVPRRPLPASEQQCAHARCRDRHKLYSAYVGDHVTSFFSEHVRLLSTSFAPDSSAHVPLRPLPASEQQCAHARQVTPLQAAWIAARARVNNVGVTLRRKSGRGARDLRLQIRFNFKAMTMSWS